MGQRKGSRKALKKQGREIVKETKGRTEDIETEQFNDESQSEKTTNENDPSVAPSGNRRSLRLSGAKKKKLEEDIIDDEEDRHSDNSASLVVCSGSSKKSRETRSGQLDEVVGSPVAPEKHVTKKRKSANAVKQINVDVAEEMERLKNYYEEVDKFQLVTEPASMAR